MTSLKLSEVISALGEALPLRSAGYAKDALGLQVGIAKDAALTKALIAYEVTHDVISEAIDVGANLIISYHPLIFPHLANVTDATRSGALVRALIKDDIALYVVHTAFDTNIRYGTSRLMADALGLMKIKPLAPLANTLEKIVVFAPQSDAATIREAMWNAGAGNISNYDECSFTIDGEGTFKGNADSNPTIGKPMQRETLSEKRIEMIAEKWRIPAVVDAIRSVHRYEEVAYDVYPLSNVHPSYGMGSIGELSSPLSSEELLAHVKNIFGTGVLRHNGIEKRIRKLAMLGGSGMEYYSAARSEGADCFITGDIHYHDFHRASHDGMLLVDAGHAETEQFVTRGLLKVVQSAWQATDSSDETFKNFVITSRQKSNIVHYY